MATNIKESGVDLIVDFYNAEAGWLYFRITAGNKIFESVFSHVFDPIMNFKYWLEAISIGVQRAMFVYDIEGQEIRYDFNGEDWRKDTLLIADADDSDEIFLNVIVDRRQMVAAFYNALVAFSLSDKFKSNEWECVFMKERLCTALKLEEHELPEKLAILDRIGLNAAFYYARQPYMTPFPAADYEDEELRYYIDLCFSSINRVDKCNAVLMAPDEWNIPEDYESWKKKDKIVLINECINDCISGYGGSKLTKFRSRLIGQYLKD